MRPLRCSARDHNSETGVERGSRKSFRDEAADRFGAEPVGLPMGAGYAVGNRLVDAYLAATGTTAAEALHTLSRDIIDVALCLLR